MRGHGYVKDFISAVIVCYNRLDLTDKCVASILASDDIPDEFVFVDNNSTDETAEYLRELDCGIPIQIASLTENVGWGRGANIGSQLAEGEYLLHLNNDTEVQPGWLTALAKEMSSGVAAVAGKLVNPDGSPQHCGIRVFKDSNGRVTAENIQTEQPAGEVECVSLAAALVRAEAWNALGGVDPQFYCGFEDVDFGIRARLSGWKLRYTPDSVVMHIAHGSGPNRWAHTQENIALLAERWSGIL